jgi:putative ABC transport system ATP-binding protein
MDRPVLSIKDLHFSFPHATWGIRLQSFDLMAGERVACIGRSGSGKTTLINLISGILKPDGGSITLAGCDLVPLPEAERRALRLARIGLVFQEFELLEYLTAAENILLPHRLAPAGATDFSPADRVLELATRTGIRHVLDRKPARLSQGERQRVALCRALLLNPELLLADEPTGNLDPSTSDSVLDLLFDEVAATGAALLFVTHHHEVLPRFDRVLSMEDALEKLP